MKIYEFNEPFLKHYTNPDASNVIILVLIADTRTDLCVKKFKKDINSIPKEYFIFFLFYNIYIHIQILFI